MADSVDFLRKPVLVLGASGHIGARVVGALSASSRYRPVRASRRSGLAVDATKRDGVRSALRGVEYVVNCIAGTSHAMLRTTKVLCDEARASPPRRIIHLSSCSRAHASLRSPRTSVDRMIAASVQQERGRLRAALS